MLNKQLHLFRVLAQFARVKPDANAQKNKVYLESEIYVRRSHKLLHSLYEKQSPIENAQQIMKDFKLTLGQRFTHGFTPEEMKNASPGVRKAFSLNNATDSGIVAYRIQKAIEKYQKWPLDTGSTIVKAAVLCERVISFMNHMERNRQDKYGALEMTELLKQRKKALAYLRIHDYQSYLWLVKDYGLREIKYHNHDYLKYKHISATKQKRYTRIERNRTRWAL